MDTLASDADGYSAEPFADIFNRLVSQTQLFSLSTDYTRFGVWFRRETSSAVAAWTNHGTPLVDRNDPPTPTDASDDDNAGAESPGSYAYSWLSASSYRTDRTQFSYPRNGFATYEGKTLAHKNNTQIYLGDALIRVKWGELTVVDGTTPASTSATLVPIFSNFRKCQDGSEDPLVHSDKIVDQIAFRTSDAAELGVSIAADGKLSVGLGATYQILVIAVPALAIAAQLPLARPPDCLLLGRVGVGVPRSLPSLERREGAGLVLQPLLADRDLPLQRGIQLQRLLQVEQVPVAPVAGQAARELLFAPAAARPVRRPRPRA